MPEKYIDVAADAMVFSKGGDQLRLLLIKRKSEPYMGMWAFPGGFVNYNEDPEAAAIRELHEETGITIAAMKQLRTYGTPGRDPRGHTVSIVHYAFADDAEQPVAGDDAEDAQWVNVKDITDLAFDHMEILQYALQTLQLGIYKDRGGVE